MHPLASTSIASPSTVWKWFSKTQPNKRASWFWVKLLSILEHFCACVLNLEVFMRCQDFIYNFINIMYKLFVLFTVELYHGFEFCQTSSFWSGTTVSLVLHSLTYLCYSFSRLWHDFLHVRWSLHRWDLVVMLNFVYKFLHKGTSTTSQSTGLMTLETPMVGYPRVEPNYFWILGLVQVVNDKWEWILEYVFTKVLDKVWQAHNVRANWKSLLYVLIFVFRR